MYIYNYDEKTKEYTSKSLADFDPEEQARGRIIPLIPANATLVAPPSYNEYNEIPVMQDEGWTVKPDYRKNFYSVSDTWLVQDIREIGELEEGLYLVEKETGEEIKANYEQFKIEDGAIVKLTDEEYQAFLEQKEIDRIKSLKLTKRVFALALQQFGITYTQLKALIATNEQAQLEWDLCVELERSNPLLDVMAAELNITPAQLDYIFRVGNGEEVNPPVTEEPEEESEIPADTETAEEPEESNPEVNEEEETDVEDTTDTDT